MKKSIMILGAVILSGGLMGLNYFSAEQSPDQDPGEANAKVGKLEMELAAQIGIKKKPAYFFQLGPRFRPIKMEDVQRSEGISDFLAQDEMDRLVEVKSVRIRKFEEEQRYTQEVDGNSSAFNEKQLAFLRSMDYSVNFTVEVVANFKSKSSDHILRDMHTPHLTIVPEKQAEYVKGMGVFYQYLREEAKAELELTDMDSLGAAKLYFTISTDGKIKDVKLRSGSNYKELDQKVIDLVKDLPGEWTPAENGEGQKVEQELVLAFGILGC